jgi:predicted metal-binding protein
MVDKDRLEIVFRDHGFDDFKWVNPAEFQVRQWVRMKCEFGCPSYGRCGTCPPNVPHIEECRDFFAEYNTAVVFRIRQQFDKPEERGHWSRDVNKTLLEVERESFKAGNYKTFLLFMDECRLCRDCAGTREECYKPSEARPSAEALGVDVFSTVRNFGYPIQVLSEMTEEMNRYAFLLVE